MQASAHRTTRFRVEGMDCAACAQTIESAVRKLDGVSDVSISVMAGTMSVSHGEGTSLEMIALRATRLGYPTQVAANALAPAPVPPEHEHADHDHDHEHEHDHEHASGPSRPAMPPGLHGHDDEPGDRPWWQTRKARLTALCAAAVALAFVVGWVLPGAHAVIFILAMAVGLVPIARRAVLATLAGNPFTIETLMTIAAIGAAIIGASEEGAVVVLLFLVGELLEGVAAGRARAGIRALASLVPSTAFREEDGKLTELKAEALRLGDIVLVRPGDRLPADGEVVSGESAVNEAPVTGESVPRAKAPGDPVFAGTVNELGVLRVRVTAAAADNTIARIVRLVEEAQEAKAPTERFIERFSRYYTPAVMLVAALVAIVPPLVLGQGWGEWVYKGLAVLLIGCPCALVISTPAAIAAALSAGARNGLLMKGGAVLETLGKVTRVALDKTGTLTSGKPQVTAVIGFGHTEDEVLSLAAALESGSSHPLASAILREAEQRGLVLPPVEAGAALGGKGVVATWQGQSVFLGSPRAAAEQSALTAEVDATVMRLLDEGQSLALLTIDGAAAGLIAMRDEPRADAGAGIAALTSLGVTPIMLTGDNARAAAAVGRTLGMEVRAELMPADKQRIVGELQRAGAVVAKVGDGINDAPALAAADVGIAMGGGADVALETADAAILNGRVMDIANLIALSRTAHRNIVQNITISLGLKVVFLVTTVIGVTGLWPAILADTGATVLVTANAMRLLGWRGQRG